MTTRLSININDDTATALRKAAADEGRTVTEIVRRMTGVYLVMMEASRDGKQIRIEDPATGSATVVTIL